MVDMEDRGVLFIVYAQYNGVLNMVITFFLILHGFLVLITFLNVMLQNRKVNVTLAWLLVLLFVPYVGILIYILFGFNYRMHKLIKQSFADVQRSPVGTILDIQKKYLNDLGKFDHNKLIYLAISNAESAITDRNQVDLLCSGEEKFRRLIEKIKDAEQYIHLEYFIWKDDALGRDIRMLLMEKAKQGVEVRILFDSMGCLFTMKRRYIREMRCAGIEIFPYLAPRFKLTITSLNNRNHRKIAIIDGMHAFVGGMNIGDEYITGGKRFSSWHDTHLMISGPAINFLQAIFSIDWENTCGKKLDSNHYAFDVKKTTIQGVPIQIISSGPDDEWKAMEQIYFSMICNANDSLYIETPYFIPGEELIQALIVAGLSGVHITIVMSGNPDKLMPFWTAYTYFEQLLTAGIEIYMYHKGFLHSKIVVVDEKVCSIGTANFDIRSLEINYEVAALIYSSSFCQTVMIDIRETIRECKQVKLEDLEQLSFWVKLRNSTVRLFSPLL